MRDRHRLSAHLAVCTVLTIPFLLLSCQSAPPAAAPHTAAKSSPAIETPRKVILLSLDGASAETLHQLHDQGALSAGDSNASSATARSPTACCRSIPPSPR